MAPILPIPDIRVPASPQASPGGARPGEFRQALESAIRATEQFRADASGRIEGFLAGENEDIHALVLSVQRAELAFEMFLQTRNKIVQAYQEIMRMQM